MFSFAEILKQLFCTTNIRCNLRLHRGSKRLSSGVATRHKNAWSCLSSLLELARLNAAQNKFKEAADYYSKFELALPEKQAELIRLAIPGISCSLKNPSFLLSLRLITGGLDRRLQNYLEF